MGHDLGDDLDLERLAFESTAPHGGEPADLGSVVLPRLGPPQSRRHALDARNLTRLVREPRLLGCGARGWAQLGERTGLQAGLRPVGVTLIDGLEGYAPTATARIGVRLEEPGTVKLLRAALELLAVKSPGRIMRAAVTREAERVMEFMYIGCAEPTAEAMPVGREHAVRETKIV